MPWFNKNGKQVWAGSHRILGAVVFDPAKQKEIPDDRVRLYIGYQGQERLLDKQIAHDCIIDAEDVGELEKLAAAYCTMKNGRRIPRWSQRRPRRSSKPVRAPQIVRDEASALPRTSIPGACVACGIPIPVARRQLVPDATLCVRCQSAAETRPSDPSASGEFCPRCARKGIRSPLVWRHARDTEISGEFLAAVGTRTAGT